MAIGDMEEEAKLHRGAITGWQNKWECAVELAAKAQADLDEERKEGEEQARLLGMGSEREAKLIAERDLWRAEAQRWREQALDLEAQIETAIKRIQWRQDNLDRGIKELKGDY
jgi:F0F1-type ATP synthase membrane subunit b/b'